MGYAQRREIISQIEVERKSKVITLITSDRYSTLQIQGVQGQIAADQISKIVQHLKAIDFDKKTPTIDLFIYSRGGDTNSAWPLVNNIRNYCTNFNILVPVHSHSSATLIALGADKIIMSKTGSLSPVDPTVANAFNPRENGNGPALGISVEDVASFFSLAKDKDKVDIKSEDNITKVFDLLASKVHPLALGNVKRSHSQIRLLAKKLLTFHMRSEEDKKTIDGIVDELTEKFFTHGHCIFRDEARSIGLDGKIVDASEKEEILLWNLYKEYEDEMELKDFFDPNTALGDDAEKEMCFLPVIIESYNLSSCLTIKQNIKRELIQDPNYRLQVLLQSEQNKNNFNALRGQLLQAQANVQQMQVGALQLQPEHQAFAQVAANLQGIVNLLGQAVSSVPQSLDLTSLKTQVEFQLKQIAWVDSMP